MNFLQSGWMVALLGGLSYLATTLFTFTLPTKSHEEHHEEHHEEIPIGPSWEYRNPEIEQLVRELKSEKEQVDKKEKELKELAARLKAEQQEVGRLSDSVKSLQEEFDKQVARFEQKRVVVKDDETANIKKLAKTYSAMAPETALVILKELSDEQIGKIMYFMKDSVRITLLETMANEGQAGAKRAAELMARLQIMSVAEGEAPKAQP